MSKKDKAIAKVESNLPAYLANDGTAGKEGIDQADLVIPRLKLLQDMSPEVKQEGEKAGTIINSVTKKNYGAELIFIPVKQHKARIFWKDREEGGGINCSSDDSVKPREIAMIDINDKPVETGPDCATCQFAKWNNEAKKQKDKAPKCAMYYNFIVAVEGDEGPVVLSMERTKIKAAKKLLSLIAYSGKIPIYGKKYKLTVAEMSNKLGTFYTYDVAPVGLVSEEEYTIAKGLYESFKEKVIENEE